MKKQFKYQMNFNGRFCGGQFFTKKEAQSEWNYLTNVRGLYGYTYSKI